MISPVALSFQLWPYVFSPSASPVIFRSRSHLYFAHWLRILRADKRALFTAASKAQAATDWLHARASVSSPELVNA
jgi:antirestriction protein ArdC